MRLIKYPATAPTIMKMIATAAIKVQFIPGDGAASTVKYMVSDEPIRPVVPFAYAITLCDPRDKSGSEVVVPVIVAFAAPSKL